jgi:hypothetical protein
MSAFKADKLEGYRQSYWNDAEKTGVATIRVSGPGRA